VAKQKRYKITFESINAGKYEVIPPEQVAESFRRINKEMQSVHRKFIRDQVLSQKRAAKLIINS